MKVQLLMPIGLTKITGNTACMTFDREVSDADLQLVLTAVQAMIEHAQQAINEEPEDEPGVSQIVRGSKEDSRRYDS